MFSPVLAWYPIVLDAWFVLARRELERRRRNAARNRAADPARARARWHKWAKSDPARTQAKTRAYYLANAEKIKARSRVYSKVNAAEVAVKGKAWREANAEKCRETKAAWKEKNPEVYRRIQRGYQRRAFHRNPHHRFGLMARGRIRKALKAQGAVKTVATVKLLGCSVEFLRRHLEAKFRDGMTWENYGPHWHVDHIKPCAKFDLTQPEEQRACFHFTNLQPLLAHENIAKGDHYDAAA
jgi:hypothetical protein